MVRSLADFVVRSSWTMLSGEALEALKLRILDALGCGVAGISGEPIRLLRGYVDRAGGTPSSTLIGGGKSAPDRAALYNGGAIRYLDFNDSYLAKGETCHPSDNLAPVLAAVESIRGSGRDLLSALAVAYQVQCRLSDEAPVRARGFDHTTQGAYAAAAGAAKALGLDAVRSAHAIAIAGGSQNALRVTRTGALSHWKGLAFPAAASAAVQAALLAEAGITGPLQVFEGNKGFMEAIAGPFEIDWPSEDLERVRLTVVKKYNAEVHSQSALEGILELRERERFSPEEIEEVRVDIFDVAYHIIGGGEEGGKTEIRTKEEADHSLPYLVAVALLDGTVHPGQFAPDRIRASDVQELLRKVRVHPSEEFSRRFPDENGCRLEIALRGGRTLVAEKKDFEGFHRRPATWASVTSKFAALTEGRWVAGEQERIIDAVRRLEELDRIGTLTALLGSARIPEPSPSLPSGKEDL